MIFGKSEIGVLATLLTGNDNASLWPFSSDDLGTAAGTFHFHGDCDSARMFFVENVGGMWDFKAELTYTSGILTNGMALTAGRIEGIGDTSNLGAKIGPIAVVPVPAAVWLFGSGLIGLIGIVNRKKA